MMRAIATALALGLVACGSSRDPVYYALQPRSGSPVRAGPRVIELERPTVAGYLDRSDIVTGVFGYRLRTRSGDAWGEPLSDMIGRVLAADLGARLDGATVLLESSGAPSEPDARISIDVRRFDEGDDGKVVLDAQVVVAPRAPAAIRTRTFTIAARPRSEDTRDIVGAMSGLLSDLSDRVCALLVESEERQPRATSRSP